MLGASLVCILIKKINKYLKSHTIQDVMLYCYRIVRSKQV